jgi:hypothetical protein
MARSSDPAKVAQWRRRLERFDLSNVSVARFCQREGVSVASFYHWRKKLAVKTRPPATPRRIAPPASAFKPLSITGAASPVVAVHLPGGARLEVPAGEYRTVRVVLRELVRSGQSPPEGGASC